MTKTKLTKLGWFMMAWTVLSLGMGVLGLLGWLSVELPGWLSKMSASQAFGAIGGIGFMSSWLPWFMLLYLSTAPGSRGGPYLIEEIEEEA